MDLFEDQFWTNYPGRPGRDGKWRKVGKKKSKEYFGRLNPRDQELCARAAAEYRNSEEAQGGYAKDPERFIKHEIFRDVVVPDAAPKCELKSPYYTLPDVQNEIDRTAQILEQRRQELNEGIYKPPQSMAVLLKERLMDFGEMIESKYLAAADLKGREIQVVIQDFRKESMTNRDTGEEKEEWCVAFQGKDKLMVLNKTNKLKLKELFPTGTEEAQGKPVILYAEQTTYGLGLRIRGVSAPAAADVPF